MLFKMSDCFQKIQKNNSNIFLSVVRLVYTEKEHTKTLMGLSIGILTKITLVVVFQYFILKNDNQK